MQVYATDIYFIGWKCSIKIIRITEGQKKRQYASIVRYNSPLLYADGNIIKPSIIIINKWGKVGRWHRLDACVIVTIFAPVNVANCYRITITFKIYREIDINSSVGYIFILIFSPLRLSAYCKKIVCVLISIIPRLYLSGRYCRTRHECTSV